MKFKIHNTEQINSFVVEGDTIEECREKVASEMKKRKWDEEDCWSEKG